MPPRGRRTRRCGAGIAYSKNLKPIARPVPSFKYTVSEERKAWVTALYPYSAALFKLFNAIPWDEYVYDTPEYTMRCSSKPYMIIGGAAAELYNDAYRLPADKHLHVLVDPTGDIDCYLSPLIVTFKRPELRHILTFPLFQDNGVPYPVEGQTNSTSLPCETALSMTGTHPILQPYTDHFTQWLLCKIEAFFKRNQPTLQTWFGKGDEIPFDKKDNDESVMSDIQLDVRPFTITRVILPKVAASGLDSLKLQVIYSVPFSTDGQEYYHQDHCMEFILSETPTQVDVDVPAKLIKGHLVRNVSTEIMENVSAIQTRADLQFIPKYKHKYFNHVFRNKFLIDLAGTFYNQFTSEQHTLCLAFFVKGLEVMLDAGTDISTIYELFSTLPDYYQQEEFHHMYRRLAERLDERMPIRGGRRKSRRKSRAFV